MHRAILCRAWGIYANIAGAAMLAALVSFLTVVSFRTEEGPVIITSDVQLLTPRVPTGGNFSFSLWRQSTESCPGTVVVSFTRLDDRAVVTSARYPLSTPGFQSPPRLTLTRQLPRQIGPGEWDVSVGVESDCITRKQFDKTAEFVLEVYDGKPD